MTETLRQHAEEQFAEELSALDRADAHPRPPSWRLSPWAVETYMMGGELDDGLVIEPKYFGNRRLIQIAHCNSHDRAGFAVVGHPRNGEDLGFGASQRGSFGRLDAAHPGDSRDK